MMRIFAKDVVTGRINGAWPYGTTVGASESTMAWTWTGRTKGHGVFYELYKKYISYNWSVKDDAR